MYEVSSKFQPKAQIPGVNQTQNSQHGTHIHAYAQVKHDATLPFKCQYAKLVLHTT